ncbi:MAG: S41 family peptidase, partial [Planctomycetota bacterium]
MNKQSRLWFQIGLLAVLAVAVFGSTLRIAGVGNDYEFFDPLIDMKHLIETRYVEEVDAAELRDAAIQGMIEHLDDPYTVYVPPADTSEFNKRLTGEYAGIGAQILVRDGWLTIVTPLDGSPALRAGLMADDRVVEIDGNDVFEVTSDEAVELLTGEAGSTVSLMIDRDGERMTIDIVRDEIRLVPIKGFHRDGPEGEWQHMLDADRGIAYIQLTQFTPGIALEFFEKLAMLGARDGSLSGLIIDLRFNAGGTLTDAIDIADLFLDEGRIVSTRGRTGPEQVAEATSSDTLTDLPIIVLVNAQSASASEILAGALQDNGRAIVLGERTVGKGSVQSVLTLPRGNGAQLKITEQLYYLPSGRSLQRTDDSAVWGVDPSPGFYVPLDREQTIELLNVRRAEDIIGNTDADDTDWTDPDAVITKLQDPQLGAAYNAMKMRIESGDWQPVSESDASLSDLQLG